MKSTFSKNDAPSDKTDQFKRDACIFSAERELPCGSIVTERNGRVIQKTAFLVTA
jgi:hypothetical protein